MIPAWHPASRWNNNFWCILHSTLGMMGRTLRSLRQYGVLSLPIVILALMGLMGHRPGQVSNRFLSYLTNLATVCNSVFAVAMALAHFSGIERLGDAFQIFFMAMEICIVFQTIYLLFVFYKPQNLLGLLMEIRHIRMHSLGRVEVIFVCFSAATFLTTVMFEHAYNFRDVAKAFSVPLPTYYPLYGRMNNTVLLRTLIVVDKLTINNLSRLAVISTSFLLAVISILLANELKECIVDFKRDFTKLGNIENNLFCKRCERFHAIASTVQQVDEMFSVIVALNLTFSFGMLCGAVMSFSHHPEQSNAAWMRYVLLSIVTLIILIPPLIRLQDTVGVFSSKWRFERSSCSQHL